MKTKLEELVGLFYEAALDPYCWPNALQALAAAFGGQNATLVHVDIRRPQLSLISSSKFDASVLDAYTLHYAANDPWTSSLMRLPAGRFYLSQDAVPLEQFDRTAFCNEFLKPIDLYFSIGGLITRTPDWATLVGVQRARRVGPFTQQQCELLTALGQHLARATRIHSRLADMNDKVLAIYSAPIAIILLNENSVVEFANDAAENLLNRGDGIKRIGTRLSAFDELDARRLERTIRRASQVRDAQFGAAVTISRPQRLPLLVHVLRLTTTAKCLPMRRRAAIALVIGDPERGREGCVGVLRDLFGLTRAEARLAQALGRGCSLDLAAASYEISKNTVRAQVRSIFEKTGTRRQQDLVRLLAHLPF